MSNRRHKFIKCLMPRCGRTKEKNPESSFFSFPKDPDRLKSWMEACGDVGTVTGPMKLCSHHFSKEDVLVLSNRHQLRPAAVPHSELHVTLHKPAGGERLGSAKAGGTAQGGATPQCSSSQAGSQSSDQADVTPRGSSSQTGFRTQAYAILPTTPTTAIKRQEPDRTPARCRLWKGDLTKSEKRNAAARKAKREAVTELARQRRKHEASERRWRREEANLLASLDKAKKEVLDLRAALQRVMTDRQVSRLITGKRQRWEEPDIVQSLSLRCISRKGYKYLREKMNFPLPGMTTLRNWTRGFCTPPGILELSLKTMENVRETLSDMERLVVISFDEMSVVSRVCYDSGEDRVYGPNSLVQVVMVRSLCSHWKQPIYYQFDQEMTRNILFEVIKKVEDAGYRVIATVCDLSATNRSLLWGKCELGGLGIRPEMDDGFQNPEDETRKIYTFADVPHLLKLLRNHILDKGIRLPSGTVVNKNLFQKLLAADCGEFKLAHKLDVRHLEVTGQERQRVYLAAQTMSERVGKAISHCFGDEHAEEAAFITLVDQVFDTFNSRHPMDPKTHRSGFGMPHALDQQYDCLLEFSRLMRESVEVGRHSLLPFQKGFIMSSSALRGLHSAVTRPQFGLKYVLTSRLNQDCVENFFSQVRGMCGANTHPTPVETKTRIRLLLMGANPAVAAGTRAKPSASGASVAMEEDAPSYLSASALGIDEEEAPPTDPDSDVAEICGLLAEAAPAKESAAAPATSAAAGSAEEPQRFSRQALAYVAGYLARKCKDVDPNLGRVPSTASAEPGPSRPELGWIESLSRGGLTLPTDGWLQLVEQFELQFCIMHDGCKDHIDKEAGVVSRLVEALQAKYPTLDKRILKKFAVTRTHMRMKWVERNFAGWRLQKRSAKRMKYYAKSAK